MASISTRKNKNGTTAYVVRVYAGRDGNGRPRYLSRSYTPPCGTNRRRIEKELKAVTEELENKVKGGETPGADQPFSEYARHFLERKELFCGDYTIHSYRFALEKACRYIGTVPLRQLNGSHLDEMLRQMREDRSQYGEPYSATYIRHIQMMVRMVLGMAVKEGLLNVNFADSAHYALPRADASEPVFLELEEARQYIRAALEEPDLKIRAMVLLFLFTGIRMEELCGLEWQDVDFAQRLVHVCRASVYVAGKGVLTKPPKTRSGVRTICADPSVFEALQNYEAHKQEVLKRKGLSVEADSRIFTREDGAPLIPGTTAVWLRRFAAKHGLRPVTPHKLRHTFATLQIAYGTDIRTVAGVMGHSSPMTTLTIYAHQVKEASEKAARAMSDMLAPKT